MKIKQITTLLLSLVFLVSSTPAFANELQQKDAELIYEYSDSNFDMKQYIDIEAIRKRDNNLPEKTITENIFEDDSPIDKNIIIIVPGLYKYDITTSDKGQVYFPSQPFTTVTNRTNSPMEINDTFTQDASVKLSGFINCEAEGEAQIKSNFGFDYSYSDIFSRTVKVKIGAGKSLKVYVEYQKIVITEKEYVIDSANPGNYKYNKTRTKTVYKPTGLTYIES